MFIAAVLISGRDWLIPGIVIFALVLLLLVWSYRRAGLGGGIRALCLSLKLIGVLALAACLLEPLWSRERARPGANYFAILADNSQGMSIKDRGATQSRGEQLQDLLTADKPAWQPVLDESFQLRRYLFDSRLQSTRDFSELAFDGRVSSMTTALRALADRYQGQPLAGVLLFTDGNATDLGEGLADLAGLPPVFPVVMGTDDPVKDVALQRVTVSQTAFEDTPVTIQAEVEATGYSGETLIDRLVEVGQPPGLPPATNSTGSAANTVTGTRLPKTLINFNFRRAVASVGPKRTLQRDKAAIAQLIAAFLQHGRKARIHQHRRRPRIANLMDQLAPLVAAIKWGKRKPAAKDAATGNHKLDRIRAKHPHRRSRRQAEGQQSIRNPASLAIQFPPVQPPTAGIDQQRGIAKPPRRLANQPANRTARRKQSIKQLNCHNQLIFLYFRPNSQTVQAARRPEPNPNGKGGAAFGYVAET
jgi:hypothetical protein